MEPFWLPIRQNSKENSDVTATVISFDKYDTLIISTKKLRKGSSFALATGVPFIIVYAMTDGLYMHEWKEDHVYDVRMNISDNPTYDEDNEPYIHIPQEDWVCLSDKPLGMDRNEIGF